MAGIASIAGVARSPASSRMTTEPPTPLRVCALEKRSVRGDASRGALRGEGAGGAEYRVRRKSKKCACERVFVSMEEEEEGPLLCE